ncbi:MAG: hypothetical protein ACRYG7_14975 [Janthinobacterium lividum]
MPILHLVDGRTCTVCASLLDLPVERLIAYQVAMSPEASIEAAAELRIQQQFHRLAQADELSQLAFAASLEVFGASAQARAFVLLVTHIEHQPVTDFSPEALRERLSWLLACGLSPEQMQPHLTRQAVALLDELRPFYNTVPHTEARVVEVFEQHRRRALALLDYLQELPVPQLTTRAAVAQAVFDVLEPHHPAPEYAALCPIVRQRAFGQLTELMLRNRRSCMVSRSLAPEKLPLSTFTACLFPFTYLLPQ